MEDVTGKWWKKVAMIEPMGVTLWCQGYMEKRVEDVPKGNEDNEDRLGMQGGTHRKDGKSILIQGYTRLFKYM
jgi:hypothetical protein